MTILRQHFDYYVHRFYNIVFIFMCYWDGNMSFEHDINDIGCNNGILKRF